MTTPRPESGAAPAAIPMDLLAPGSAEAQFRAALAVDQLTPGSLVRVSYGDLDVLLAHTPRGIFATDDRCPHQAAPFSVGDLDDCILECPMHRGRFDLVSGDPIQMPTTGGLDPDGVYHAPWSKSGTVKVDPPGEKTDARRLTRTRRLRYYRVRVVDGMIEVAVPI